MPFDSRISPSISLFLRVRHGKDGDKWGIIYNDKNNTFSKKKFVKYILTHSYDNYYVAI